MDTVTVMDTVSVGNAGEYLVAGELMRRGFSVAMPLTNTPDFDILAIDKKNPKRQFAIQVKTSNNSYLTKRGKKRERQKWRLTTKAEDLHSDNIYYVFVILNGLELPKYYIVPSKTVAERVRTEYAEWLKQPGKMGQPHNDSNVRNFISYNDEFIDNWDILRG